VGLTLGLAIAGGRAADGAAVEVIAAAVATLRRMNKPAARSGEAPASANCR
jgi:hypothetical protein